ncbi:MAG: acyl carrier protein [Planctomycetaceae bacterium]
MPITSSQDVLVNLIAAALKLPPDEVALDRPIMELGLDSVSAVTMTVQLEEQLGIPVEPTLILDYETIALLSAHLDECLAANACSPTQD